MSGIAVARKKRSVVILSLILLVLLSIFTVIFFLKSDDDKKVITNESTIEKKEEINIEIPSYTEVLEETPKVDSIVEDELSEAVRKKIYREIGDNERKADVEADKKYPYDYSKSSEQNEDRFYKYTDYRKELNELYKKELIENYKIDDEIYSKIMAEGYQKKW